MSTLFAQTILTHLTLDESLLNPHDMDSYDSYTVPDDTVVQVSPNDRDDPDFYTVTYVQVMNRTKNGCGNVIIFQLEGLPEDPASFDALSEVQVRIYTRTI